MKHPPPWWSWDLEFSPHLLKRMLDREFSEVELRIMLEEARGYHVDHEPGRWAIETRHAGQPWTVIVEPAESEQLLVIITAYAISP
jgi:hypothetical protein